MKDLKSRNFVTNNSNITFLLLASQTKVKKERKKERRKEQKKEAEKWLPIIVVPLNVGDTFT